MSRARDVVAETAMVVSLAGLYGAPYVTAYTVRSEAPGTPLELAFVFAAMRYGLFG